jgi:hypothetical protein
MVHDSVELTPAPPSVSMPSTALPRQKSGFPLWYIAAIAPWRDRRDRSTRVWLVCNENCAGRLWKVCNKSAKPQETTLFFALGGPTETRSPVSGVRKRDINEIIAFHPLLKPLNAVFDHRKPSKKPSVRKIYQRIRQIPGQGKGRTPGAKSSHRWGFDFEIA